MLNLSPTPKPTISLPPLMLSTVLVIFASKDALRKFTFVTRLPTLILDVRAATAEISDQPSRELRERSQ